MDKGIQWVKMQKATFAGGCFWCTEAIFKNIRGVKNVEVGYSGGAAGVPTYEEVSTGKTGYAEAIQVTFEPKLVSYSDLLYLFFRTHDPTTKDRQGPDFGPQYRSVIFYKDGYQKIKAEKEKKKAQKLYDSHIVTEIIPFKNFFPAEDNHQNYYGKNKNNSYCKVVIDPKIRKLQKDFRKYLK